MEFVDSVWYSYKLSAADEKNYNRPLANVSKNLLELSRDVFFMLKENLPNYIAIFATFSCIWHYCLLGNFK